MQQTGCGSVMMIEMHPGYRKEELFPAEYSCLGLAAPAGPVSAGQFRAVCDFLTGLGVRFVPGKSILEGETLSYLSAPAESRAADLNELIRNPEISAIYCLRGGYGSVHLLDRLDWTALKQRGLPVIGYSDITVLHAAMQKNHAGIAVSACMGLTLEQDAGDADFRRDFRRALGFALHPGGDFREIAVVKRLSGADPGADAPLFCGNLTMLASLCGTGSLPDTAGKIILLEDIGEPVRKIDRSLMQLALSGFFRGCAGVVLGDFQDCGEAAEQQELFRRFASKIDLPVFSGLHYGHCRRSLSLVGGEPVRIRNGVLSLCDPFNGKRP